MMPASGPVPKAAQRCTRALHPAPSRKRPQRCQVHLAHAPGQGSSYCAVRAYPGIPKTEKRPELQFFCDWDCCGEPKRVSRRKSAANRLIGSQFVLCTDKRGSAIAKKLHEYRDFCFRNGKITITGRILKRDTDERENPSGRRRWRKDSRISSDRHWAQVQRSCKWHKTSGAAGGSHRQAAATA